MWVRLNAFGSGHTHNGKLTNSIVVLARVGVKLARAV